MTKIQPVVLTTVHRDPVTSTEQLRVGFGSVLVHRDSLGAAYGTWRAIEKAVEHRPGAHVLFLEDDVVLHPRLAMACLSLHWPSEVGVVSFGDWREMPSVAAPGVYLKSAMGCDGRGWQGNQAMLIHRDTAAMLAKANWFSEEIERSRGVTGHRALYDDGGRNCSDLRMAMLVHASPRPLYAVHVPSLALHVGHKSACFPDRAPVLGERETRNYAPEDWRPVTNNIARTEMWELYA